MFGNEVGDLRREFGGHANISTTSCYLATTPTTLETAMKHFADVLNCETERQFGCLPALKDTAFDLFMRGVCGEHYRSVLEQRLGVNGVDEAIRQSAFFFRDEVPAVLESTFGAADAARIHCPVLVAEGADGDASAPLAQQITALATRFLPHAEVMSVASTNHMMPLQDPEAVARVIHGFVGRHS